MTRYLSPLRYPGGKARLAPFVAKLISAQRPRPSVYAEPFAGGAGAALRLLVDEHVDEVWLNDLNPGIAALWRSVVERPFELSARVRSARVDLEAWHDARETYRALPPDDVELGFATLFLNRCNRSGILDAGPIGGLAQTGAWKIDARFNHRALADRIDLLGGYRARIRVSELDAREFLRQIELDERRSSTLVYVDPPYLGQGDNLYLNKLTAHDHGELAAQLVGSDLKWFLTYDADPRIPGELYPDLPCVEFDIAHTAQNQHVGVEYAVFSANLENVPGRLMASGDSRVVSN